MQNHFQLFQLPQQFAVDKAALEHAYHAVQQRVHPDRFAHALDSERRVAMQWAVHANEAYKILKNPFQRAKYLCELHGVDLEAESNTAMSPDFLMQQMTWREMLDDARMAKDLAALDALAASVLQEHTATLDKTAAHLDNGNFHQAAALVRQLMFLEKFTDEVALVQDALI